MTVSGKMSSQTIVNYHASFDRPEVLFGTGLLQCKPGKALANSLTELVVYSLLNFGDVFDLSLF